MLNIKGIDWNEVWQQTRGYYIDLSEVSEIETRFVEIVNTDSRAFKDEASLNFMLEVDKAKRVGAYPLYIIGASCGDLYYYKKKENEYE